MSNTGFTRIRRCALAIGAVCFIGGQASAQQGGPAVTVVNTPLPVTVTNPSMSGTPVAFTFSFGPGFGSGNVFMVPMGQRLVIEYVSGLCSGFGSLISMHFRSRLLLYIPTE